MLFMAVLHVAKKRFIADAAIVDSMIPLQRKEKGEKRRLKARAGKTGGGGAKGKKPIRCGEC